MFLKVQGQTRKLEAESRGFLRHRELVMGCGMDGKSTLVQPFIDQQSGSGTGGGRKRAQERRELGEDRKIRAGLPTGAEGSGRGKKKRSRGGVRGRVEWVSVGTGDRVVERGGGKGNAWYPAVYSSAWVRVVSVCRVVPW